MLLFIFCSATCAHAYSIFSNSRCNSPMATEEVNKRSLKGTRLSGVQLKLIGENLEVLQQYEKKLELVCTCEGKSSKVAVYDGE